MWSRAGVRHKDREYETTLVRRSYRDGDRVRKQTLANLSHLPPEAIDAVRRVLRGRDAGGRRRGAEDRALAAGTGTWRRCWACCASSTWSGCWSRERCRERDLCVAMICQRLIGAGLEAVGHAPLRADARWPQSSSSGRCPSASCCAAMDWLLERQDRIERALARRHLAGDGYVLYDLSSSYVEGRCCPLAALGYSRDGRRGTPADQLRADLRARGPAGRDRGCTPATAATQRRVPAAVAAVARALRDLATRCWSAIAA